MNWYKIIKFAKFLNSDVAICEHCLEKLFPIGIEENSSHIYNIGQIWSCDCKKSRIWTNSIRGEQELLDFYDGKTDRYSKGFCNDKYCPVCWGYVQPIKNGIEVNWSDRRYDRYGCMRCKGNQNIAMNTFLEDSENDGVQRLILWYKNMRRYWEFRFREK